MTDTIKIDRKATYLCDAANIDTKAFLKATLGREVTDILTDEIREGWMLSSTDEIIEILGDRTEREYALAVTENVYNCENDFSNVFQFSVFTPVDADSGGDWYYCDDVYIAVEVHIGGDVRGNYGPVRLYEAENLADKGFLDWMIGWDVEDTEGERIERMSEECSPGYSSNPGCRLAEIMGTETVENVEGTDTFRIVKEFEDDDGFTFETTFIVTPYSYAGR
jgi:hypothetical protein